MEKYEKDDIVTVNNKIIEKNSTGLCLEDDAYIVSDVVYLGEKRAYHLKGLNNGSQVFVQNEKTPYAFVEKELEMLCPKIAYTGYEEMLDSY